MKIRNGAALLIALLTLSLLTGCSARTVITTLDVAEDTVEQHLEAAEKAVEETVLPAITSKDKRPTVDAEWLTPEEAEAIALKHAGLTADQVSGLHSQFERDDSISHYDVQFRQGQWEYEYEIHGETGGILSVEKDN